MKKLSLKFNEESLNYYAQKQSPNFSEFKEPDFKDNKGRLYKIALDHNKPIKSGLGSMKFYIKLPKKTEWFNQKELLHSNINFTLENGENINLKLESCFRIKNSKTGYVFLNGKDLNKLLYLS